MRKVGSLRKWITDQVADIAEDILPRTYKRAIYISTILRCFKVEASHKELVSKLNLILNGEGIYISNAVLKSTALVWSRVFQDYPVICIDNNNCRIEDVLQQPITEGELQSLAQYFAKHVPSWMRYGSDNLLAHNAQQALRQFC